MAMKTVVMELAKATKGTFVYEVANGQPLPICRSVYLPKDAVGVEPPKEIKLTVEWK